MSDRTSVPFRLTFDWRVYALVACIPAGKLAIYEQIYGSPRQVGLALGRLRLPSEIPWHLVVNVQGRISLSPAREGSDWTQRDLLQAEGIPVEFDGSLPLNQFRWTPEATCRE